MPLGDGMACMTLKLSSPGGWPRRLPAVTRCWRVAPALPWKSTAPIGRDSAKADLHERLGKLVPVDEFTAWWEAEVAGPLRRAVENLKRQHGEAVAELVAKPLRKAQAAVEKRLTEGGGDD